MQSTESAAKQQAILLESLRNPSLYPHPVSDVALLETHVSHIILAGDFAYKIKKPLDLGFLDFGTLEKRAACCREELRLNRRLAPQVYLDVVTFTGCVDSPEFNGTGDPLEYAVRMKRFSQEGLWSRRMARGDLRREDFENLGRELAAFHRRAAVVRPEEGFGTPSDIADPVQQNFSQIKALLDDRFEEVRLAALETWTRIALEECRGHFLARLAGGFVRECHGDLHLENIATMDGEPVIFDGIEFNPGLRWIDVANDLAFLFMDLVRVGRRGLAYSLLSAWLGETGDYGALAVLRFYLVYRALVRAKVALIRAHQLDGAEKEAAQADFHNYLELAERCTLPTQSALLLLHGFSGSGKSVLAATLTHEYGAVWLRSDVERRRMFGIPGMAGSGSPLDGGIYTQDATAQIYAHLLELARLILVQGQPVIVDATFLRAGQREPFWQLAEALNVPHLLIDCQASVDVLGQRITARAAGGGDPSEADLAVLDVQLRGYEKLEAWELERTLVVNTEQPLVMPDLLSRLRHILSISGLLAGHR